MEHVGDIEEPLLGLSTSRIAVIPVNQASNQDKEI
jgi:hypothetical protein